MEIVILVTACLLDSAVKTTTDLPTSVAEATLEEVNGEEYTDSLRLDLYVFGISVLWRMGSASMLIQI